jgi:serine/threonine-protein kinase
MAAQPPPIRFLIASEPGGALVTYEGRALGETPVELLVPPGPDGRASARLTFSLDGYHLVTVIAEGEGSVVFFNQKLKKKLGFQKKLGFRSAVDKDSSRYKDDPY